MNPLANPAIKTIASQTGGLILGAVANSVDTALQNPVGGTAGFLGAHPAALIGYTVGISFIHNVISHLFPPGK